MKLTIGITALGLACSTFAGAGEFLDENFTKNESKQTDKYRNMEELPQKVQDSIKKVCRGKVVSIKEIKMNNAQYYRVVCEMDSTKKAYLFDSEGNHPK